MSNVEYKKIFLEYLKGCGLSIGTIVRMKWSLKLFYNYLNGKDVKEIREKEIILFVKYLRNIKTMYKRELSESSIELSYGAVKSFYIFLYNNEYILNNPCENLKIKLKGIKKEIRMFNNEEIGIFLDNIGIEDKSNERDRAYFELMYSSGLRAREGLNLELEDINFDERILMVKSGKGKKDRYVPFSETALKFMLKYVNDGRNEYLKEIRGNEDKKWLFLYEKGKVSYWMVLKRFRKYLTECKLNKKGYRIHSIRHSTATHLLEAGASIRYVQELLGHENIETTQIYTRPCIDNVRKIYKSYHPRENEYFDEISEEYLENLKKLKKKILICRKEKKRGKELQKMRESGKII